MRATSPPKRSFASFRPAGPTPLRYPSVFQRQPRPGHVDIYGAVLHCRLTDRYCLVQGQRTGKWSFPKGHIKKDESPLECVARETAEETGIDQLPSPQQEVRLRAGVYYAFEVPFELGLNPRDHVEIGAAGWFTLAEMAAMNLNIDANTFVRRRLQHTVTFNRARNTVHN
jgi:8-oxo-dGTP pyrophosphatase MutT (NUDIX family)